MISSYVSNMKNSFEGQKHLNCLNNFTELPKALPIILFIIHL